MNWNMINFIRTYVCMRRLCINRVLGSNCESTPFNILKFWLTMWTTTILVSRKSMASIVTSVSIVHEDIARLRKVTVAGYCGIQDTTLGSDWERLQRGEACECEEWAGPGATFSHASRGEVVFQSLKPRWNSPLARPRPVTRHAGCPGNTEQD